ncbi:MAG: hypothetical protein ACPGGB_08590 [Flavobacteriales bacterium]
MLPQAATGIASTAIFCLIFAWNEYAFALLLTSGNAQTAPPVDEGLGAGVGSLNVIEELIEKIQENHLLGDQLVDDVGRDGGLPVEHPQRVGASIRGGVHEGRPLAVAEQAGVVQSGSGFAGGDAGPIPGAA